MKQFKKLNNIIGWSVFLIATFSYLATMEKTASLWDCGEFISAAYKLEVVHSPGAPLFLMIGRIFTLFASDVTQVAVMVNSMSALASSFTILFLFWTITAFGRRIYLKETEIETSTMFAILGAGIVGSLAYTFSDSFWFSAVEGEVYALSSFFTAVTFWCILKWEQVADSPHSSKWLVLIAYLIGLSIGVHLLSLLTIPAMGMIYYFKNNKYSHKGALKAFAVSSAILLFIQGIFIPKTAALMGWFDKLFVNSFGLPFNSGVIFCILLIIGLIIYSIIYTLKNNKSTWNTAILGILVLLIGYSSYATVLIRSQANTPINMSAPDDPIKLSSYLAREQYGEVAPLLFGRYYSDRAIGIESEEIYEKNEEKGEYEQIGLNQKNEYENNRFFSRMYENREQKYIDGYQLWAPHDQSNIKFSDNLKFFFKYQIGHSYLRYFMWNFAGRQNDIANMDGNPVYGNWEGGLSTSKYKESPEYLKNNKGKNHYYFLPLIIGIIGIFFHFKSQKTDAISVLLFFLFTGVFIILYLNVPPEQPRERDYAYVGSFYAFAIWIGIGVLGIYNYLIQKINKKTAAILSTAICLVAVPVLMASENWDDHDRTGRTIALDVGKNYLEHLDSNAIIFSNGDNDTYPLWYAQEVEGIRHDVRNVNMSLLGTEKYINQVKKQVYEAAPVPSILTHDFYKGNKGFVRIIGNKKDKKYIPILKAIHQIKNNKTCPRYIKIPIPDSTNKAKKSFIKINLPGKGKNNQNPMLYPNDIALLDILANFDWERPLYFISADATLRKFKGIMDYIQIEGAVQKLVKKKTESNPINIKKSYDLLMNQYNYGNMNNPDVYFCHYSDRSIFGFKQPFVYLAEQLIREKDYKRAIMLADKYFEMFPLTIGEPGAGSYGQESIQMAGVYPKSKSGKGKEIIDKLLLECQTTNHYLSLLPNLKGQGKKLDSQCKRYIILLNGYNKILSDDKEKDQNEANNKGRVTNAQLKLQDDGYTIEESGLAYKVINTGDGSAYPTVEDTVKIHFTGKVEDGKRLTKEEGVENLMPVADAAKFFGDGFSDGIQMMVEGDKWELIIPSDLAFGDAGAPQSGIGPNATLIFEIELLKINPREENNQSSQNGIQVNPGDQNQKIQINPGNQNSTIPKTKEKNNEISTPAVVPVDAETGDTDKLEDIDGEPDKELKNTDDNAPEKSESETPK